MTISVCGKAIEPGRQSCRVRRSSAELREITPEWIELYGRCAGATPFQRPEWLLAWIEEFTPRELWAVELRDEERLAGLAVMLIYPRGGERVLAFAGGGVSDYQGMLCEGGREAEMVQAIVENVEADWDVMEFTDVRSDSQLLDVSGLKKYAREHDFCSVLALPESKKVLLQQFSKRQRANLRGARSRLEHAGGGTVETATQENVLEFLEELFVLHTTRWSDLGEPGVLHDDRVREFHRAAAPSLHARGILRLHRLRIRGQTAAILHSLWDRDTVFCYLQGFDPAYSALSPGTYLFSVVMDLAIESGMRRFDFLRGDEAYKRHWRPKPAPSFCIEMTRNQLLKLHVAEASSNSD